MSSARVSDQKPPSCGYRRGGSSGPGPRGEGARRGREAGRPPEVEIADVDLIERLLRNHVHGAPYYRCSGRHSRQTNAHRRRGARRSEADGGRGLTHRAVDRRAGLPQGSTSNYFNTREALLEAALARLVELEQPSAAQWRRSSPMVRTSRSRRRAGRRSRQVVAGARPRGSRPGSLRAVSRSATARRVPRGPRRGAPRIPRSGRAAAANRGLHRPASPRAAAAGAVGWAGLEPAPSARHRAFRRRSRRSARALLRTC